MRPSTRTADSRLTTSFRQVFRPLTATTLVRGQKLPIFSASGLPHNDIALQIARQAKLKDSDEEFIVVFCAMGITAEEYNFFRSDLERTGGIENAVLFVNLADDPLLSESLPRLALTAAEYLAFEKDYHVLVIYTDMTNYCDALRQIGAAVKKFPVDVDTPDTCTRTLAALRACWYREGEEGFHYPIPNSDHAR